MDAQIPVFHCINTTITNMKLTEKKIKNALKNYLDAKNNAENIKKNK